MECKHCGTALSEEAKFCPNCGKPVQHEQQTPVTETQTNQTKSGLSPTMMTGLLLSAIAFLTGLILFSILLSKKGLLLGHDTLVFLPAFAGLAFDTFALSNALAKKNSFEKLLSIVALSLAGFAVFYGFLTYCILAA